MQPEFTDEEQYLISYWRSGREQTVASQVSTELSYLAGPLIMVGLGSYYESYLLAMSAVLVYASVKIREVVSQTRWWPVLANIVRKYDAKIAELDAKCRHLQATLPLTQHKPAQASPSPQP
jgi:hypothetical protein